MARAEVSGQAAAKEARGSGGTAVPAAGSLLATAPDDVRHWLAWAAGAVGATPVGYTRLATVRPAWRFDLQGSRGAVTPFILRCARPAGFGLSSVYTLKREAQLLRALHLQSYPVPRVEAETSAPDALLLECLPGTSDFSLLDADPAWKARVVDDFVELLVKLHAIPLASLDFERQAQRPASTRELPLRELSTWRALYLGATRARDALVHYALHWLEREAPEADDVVLVQGDTGPNQCLFDERGVTGVLDWELAHYGDPMEDLGWIAARTPFASYGSLPALLQRYARLSGRTLDFGRIAYYRVMALAKCAIATGLAREAIGPDDDIGSILLWDTITRHALAWSLVHHADPTAHGVLPASPADADPTTVAVAGALRNLAAAAGPGYEAVRYTGLADTIVWLALQRADGGRRAQAGLYDEVERLFASRDERGETALLRGFLDEAERDSILLAKAFGPRGRIRLEALE
jgi:aminoglycoside phosphotransferase (APT) family kinase protein